MKNRITIGQYFAALIHNFTTFFYQNLFSVDSFTYLENNDDIEVIYRITGKRRPILRKTITQLIKDQKKLNCFSREDVSEMSILYGRLMEKRLHNKKLDYLHIELTHLKNKLQLNKLMDEN